MIRKRFSQLKARLLGDKARLEKELEEIDPRRVEAAPNDEEEQADEVEEKASRIAMTGIIRRRLRRIKSALTKMQNKAYGVCENCGKPIEEKLLEIDPESRYCISCKQKLQG